MPDICFASYDDEPALGGQGRSLIGLRDAVTHRGWTTTTVAGRGASAVRFPRILHRAPLDFSLYINRHPDLLVNENPSLVHALGGPGGLLLLRHLPVPLVYSANHTYTQAHRVGRFKRLLSPLEARAYRGAAAIAAISDSTALAVRRMGIPESRITVISPGIDIPNTVTDEFEPGRLLFVGRLEPEKGVLDAVAVMCALAEKRSGIHGVVVGTGSLLEAVQKIAQRHPNVLDIMGSVSGTALQEEYAKANLVIMPSRFEGLGLVALEALAAGTPVVGYDVVGLRDAAKDGGVLVPHGDVRGLVEACKGLMDDSVHRKDLSQRGRAAMVESYSWDAVVPKFEELYRSVQ